MSVPWDQGVRLSWFSTPPSDHPIELHYLRRLSLATCFLTGVKTQRQSWSAAGPSLSCQKRLFDAAAVVNCRLAAAVPRRCRGSSCARLQDPRGAGAPGDETPEIRIARVS